MKIKLPIGRGSKKAKKEETQPTENPSSEKKGKFSRIKFKRGKKEEELESVTVVEPDEFEELEETSQEVTSDHPGLHKIDEDTESQELGTSEEFEAQELGTSEEFEAQELGDEDELEEMEKEPKKKSKGKKKIIIIAPIIIAAFLGIWIMGIIPPNDFLPESPIGSQIVGSGISQSVTSENTEELEHRIISLEEKINDLSAKAGEGRQGPQGATGDKGEQGLPGLPGEKGDSGKTLVPIQFGTGEQSTKLTSPIYVGVNSNYWGYNAVKVLMPIDGVIKNLNVIVDRDPKIPIIITLLKNGFKTDLSCRLDTTISCSDNTNSVSIEVGDTIAIKLDKGAVEDSDSFHLKAGVILHLE